MPEVSIVVRSYNRLPLLCELLELLLAQDHQSFEIVVVEQSNRPDPDAEARLRQLEEDARLRVLRHPPLGGARARNVGVEASRGDLILFIDDDDLPAGNQWIAAHVANFRDPKCMGVSGRQENTAGETNPYGRRADLAYRRCQMFSPLLKLPWAYVRQTRRKVPVDGVHGTNGAIRREAFERFGGWDVDTRIEDEASFGYRAQRAMTDGEYFCFDPRPVVVRRLDVRGGLDKRFMTAGQYCERLLDFAHHIIGRYFPGRIKWLYPLYALALYGWTVDWIWTDSQRYATLPARVGATVWMLGALPFHVTRSLVRFSRRAPTGSDTGSPSRSSDPPHQNTSP
ncbi:MAG TPA: glycosyltransferase [Kofleriaceae bacterium]|nr:glycosyltransferase [Kofleriaceae bacterium]